jgi:preprotein translocase SecE subunit
MNELNREQKRLLQRQGTLDEEGAPVLRREPRRTAPAPSQARGFHPRQFLDEVILELRKVMKPKRPELINYATVVFFTLAFVMALVFGLDWLFSIGSGHLFK